VPFQGIRLPHLRMGPGIDKSPTGSKQINCSWACSSDRLRNGYKIRYFTFAAQLGYHVREMCGEIRPPVLALAGDKDVVVAPKPRYKEEYRKYLREELCAGHAEVIAYQDGHHAMVVPKTGDARVDRTSNKVLADVTKRLDRYRTDDHPKAKDFGSPQPAAGLSAGRSASR
jgi:pimeloyl-ACP methyl ester carboxylesterase